MTGDIYRIGVGAGLILLLIPLFILAIIAKFFIDRSRAAQRLAELKRKEAEYHRMSQQVTEAKLSALQAQVEPHFLYNTLASVQALTEVDPAQANAMTGHLIQYLRNALPKMRESVSTVGQEIELVRAYLNILQMRMGKRLTFESTCRRSSMELPFPPLMLPSLVENAIKHGLEPQREGGSVAHHRAAGATASLRLIVADTGRGFGETLGAGVGLANIRERLAALYGDAREAHAGGQRAARRGRDASRCRRRHARAAPRAAPRSRAAAPVAAAAPAAPPQPQPRTRPRRARSPPWARAERVVAQGPVVRLRRAGDASRPWSRASAIVGITTASLPVQLGDEALSGPRRRAHRHGGNPARASSSWCSRSRIVLAVIYGLGFLFVGARDLHPDRGPGGALPGARALRPARARSGGMRASARKAAAGGERIEPTAAAEVESRACPPRSSPKTSRSCAPSSRASCASSGPSSRSSPPSRTAPPRSRRSRTARPTSCSSTSRCPR